LTIRNSDGTEQKVQVFETGYQGPINTAVSSDMDGDGKPEWVCAPGAGGGPRVSLRNGSDNAEQKTFFAYEPSFLGGVSISAGVINGINALVTGAGSGGGPHLKIFNLITGAEMISTFVFAPQFKGGISVSLADTNLDGVLDVIVAAGSGGGPHIKIFDGLTFQIIREFFAYDPQLNVGASVFTGNFDSDLNPEIAVALGAGGLPLIRIFDASTGLLEQEIQVFESSFTGGVVLGASDYNKDGKLDLLAGAGVGGAPRVKVYNNNDYKLLDDFFAGDSNLRNGVSF
jgi:hypothetical protein